MGAGEDPTRAQGQCLNNKGQAGMMAIVRNHECTMAEINGMHREGQFASPSCGCGTALMRLTEQVGRECDVHFPPAFMKANRKALLSNCDEIVENNIATEQCTAHTAGTCRFFSC